MNPTYLLEISPAALSAQSTGCKQVKPESNLAPQKEIPKKPAPLSAREMQIARVFETFKQAHAKDFFRIPAFSLMLEVTRSLLKRGRIRGAVFQVESAMGQCAAFAAHSSSSNWQDLATQWQQLFRDYRHTIQAWQEHTELSSRAKVCLEVAFIELNQTVNKRMQLLGIHTPAKLEGCHLGKKVSKISASQLNAYRGGMQTDLLLFDQLRALRLVAPPPRLIKVMGFLRTHLKDLENYFCTLPPQQLNRKLRG